MTTRSIIYVIAAASQARFNAILEARGMGPGNVAQPASASGNPPATYFFGHAWETDAGEAMFTAYKAGTVPPEVRDADLTRLGMTRTQAENAGRAVALTAILYRGDRPRTRVDTLLTSMGLKAIEVLT